MNLIGNVLLPVIVELTQLSINYMPKDPKEYYDYLSSKIGKEKMVIEKQIVQKWFQSERPHIRASIDSLHQFVEALEFNLMKVASALIVDRKHPQQGPNISFKEHQPDQAEEREVQQTPGAIRPKSGL